MPERAAGPTRRSTARTLPRLAFAALLGGCGTEHGIVEVYWQVEDAALERIYPQGSRPNTCDFTSRSGERFDLRVRLSIVRNTEACAAEPDAPDCSVIEPLLFACDRARGTATEVPPSAEGDSDPGYLMFVDPVIVPRESESFVASPTCVSRPGPRVRKIRGGRIADLEIYQLIIQAIDPTAEGVDARLDLDGCRDESGDSGDSDDGSQTDTGMSTDTDSTGTDSTG